MCLSCQLVCRTLNATLEAQDFAQAAGLTPEHFYLDEDVGSQLEVALAVLHEAMLEAVLEFESMDVEEPEVKLTLSDPVGVYAAAHA
jgi:hypothetical protein